MITPVLAEGTGGQGQHLQAALGATGIAPADSLTAVLAGRGENIQTAQNGHLLPDPWQGGQSQLQTF